MFYICLVISWKYYMGIPQKKKLCKGECNSMQYLFSKGMCKSCWARLHKKPINPISKSQQNILDEYKPIRKKFLEENQICQARVKCNGAEAVEVHHRAGKGTKKLWLDTENFLAICRECHQWEITHSEEAKELGISKRRI